MFLRQQWYVAAMPGEVKREPLGRLEREEQAAPSA